MVRARFSIFAKLTPPQVLVIGFALVIFIGATILTLPISAEPGKHVSFLDALFTATSAVCVTGLVVVDTATTYSHFGEMIILTLIQVGGLGFMTFATLIAMMLGKKIGVAERRILTEAFNQLKMEGIVRLVKAVVLITVVIEGIGFLILASRFVPEWGWSTGLYYALFHAVSAFNNAGFDLFGDYEKFSNLTRYVSDPTVNLTIGFLIILGGIGFVVIREIIYFRKTKRLSLHTKLVLTMSAILIIMGTLLLLLIEWSNPATMKSLKWEDKILSAWFQSVSTRTAGFNSINIGAMYPASLFIMILLMFVGASPSSTGGGIKTTTLASILLAVWNMIRGRSDVVAFKRRIPNYLVYKALTVTVASLTVVMLVTILLTITERADLLTAMFETVSAFGTVGLTMGLTPNLTPFGKVLIALTMFAGRVGTITIALALAKIKKQVPYKYPEEKPMIG
ncbi:TrkH family potassium uptake protein [Thermoflavimicrobium daqui]|uniref:Trk family potassium uptake protein n=1 Tax=Thermoflavimicrobium daqui TaxID=2137476 RepID=A0A364K5K9_9BACL|nr:TrkH family potassium uptake protein [Thermoflavimicrobium daqui]RAL25573.1 Trk family potassium uptake protein [Thermoflavimicrobium daqui]